VTAVDYHDGMSDAAAATRTVVVERDIPHPPEKIWRALTQPHFLEEWLMKNDFAAEVGRRFEFRGDWGSVKGEVKEIEPNRRLSYTWGAFDLGSVVTWTLTPTGSGTRLRMEQSGFRLPEQKQAFMGATAGWPRMFDKLEAVLERAE
jgi:uncharacterized protein YndB with AHSA1/START domain